MENVSTSSVHFVLLGLVEMEKGKSLCIVLALGIYLTSMILSSVIVYTVWVEAALHEPMYLFICNLLLNGMFGSSSLFPRLIIDLLSGFITISYAECLIQTFCMHTFAAVEILTFTIMAQDRYLAIGAPLRYPTLMTNRRALTYVAAVWTVSFIQVIILLVMTMRLHLCGVNINNVYCDNMSLVRLACGDTSMNSMFGAVQAVLGYILILSIVIYCYVKTFLICLRFSRDAYHKATRTLVSHLVAFSCFIVANVFVFLRYRLDSSPLALYVHVIFSCLGIVTSAVVNPFIYGIRTEALRGKIVQNILKTAAAKQKR
uniref:G-protein coupled receptors family 1 profile domain-containing protein n=1 Tax=Leptobrachium leishanense TaxID=445787 RepID=A0A8C5R382_9ANUR